MSGHLENYDKVYGLEKPFSPFPSMASRAVCPSGMPHRLVALFWPVVSGLFQLPPIISCMILGDVLRHSDIVTTRVDPRSAHEKVLVQLCQYR